MILIGDKEAAINTTNWPGQWQYIYSLKMNSPATFRYPSVSHLQFELRLRSALTEAARALNRSGARFATFRTSYCNEQFWNLNRKGGFELRDGVTPAQGIRDIFMNGRRYAFECATATVIIQYKGVLDSIDEGEFNRLFANLLLYDWHYDSDLRLIEKKGGFEAFPGDVQYFINPEVRRDQIEWQGENAIKLDHDLYFAHGIGILSGNAIISHLNRHRRPGATVSAYLTDQVVYPDFLYLSQFAPGGSPINTSTFDHAFRELDGIYSQVGGRRVLIA